MFHAISQSKHSPFSSNHELKRAMHDALAPETQDRARLAPVFSYYYSSSEPVDVDKWRQNVCAQGVWGTEFDMVIFSCLYKVNIKSYSQVDINNVLEHSCIETRQALDFLFDRSGFLYKGKDGKPLYNVEDFIPAGAPTIFLFNHHAGQPSLPVPRGPPKWIHNNHYAYLEPCQDMQGKAPVYYGGNLWSDPHPDTPKPFNDVAIGKSHLDREKSTFENLLEDDSDDDSSKSMIPPPSVPPMTLNDDDGNIDNGTDMDDGADMNDSAGTGNGA